MSRKTAIIAIILLLQNYSPQYQLTVALIVMFLYNLLHVKYHPYDLFYHDRLEFLSLISSEMTLFGGLVITFLETDKKNCITNCETSAENEEATSYGIGWAIIFFNVLYLVYFSMGLFFHMYFVLIPKSCRCSKVEEAATAAHEKLSKHAPNAHKAIFPNHHHKYHRSHKDIQKVNTNDVALIDIKIRNANKTAKEDAQELANELAAGHKMEHDKLKERLAKKKKRMKKAEQKYSRGILEEDVSCYHNTTLLIYIYIRMIMETI